MTRLSSSERKYLRGVAHRLKPVVQIGKEGLSDTVVDAIDAAIEAHELIKVKVAADREGREQLVAQIEEQIDCECVASIGRVAILFRRNPDPEKQRVSLPTRNGR